VDRFRQGLVEMQRRVSKCLEIFKLLTGKLLARMYTRNLSFRERLLHYRLRNNMKVGVKMLGADHSHDLNEILVWVNGTACVKLVHAPLMDNNICAIGEEHASEVDFRSAEVHLPQHSALFNIPAK
jgi:hypothetical protein